MPEDFPISAASAEFLAVSIALRACNRHAPEASATNPGRLQLVSDCQAVCAAFGNLQRHYHYKSKFAGLWFEPAIRCFGTFHKTRAHLSRSDAEILGCGQWWEGNTRADHWATVSKACPGPEAKLYKANIKLAVQSLWDVGLHIAESVCPDIALLKKTRGAPRPTRPVPNGCHSFCWQRTMWVCSTCGIAKRKRNSMVDRTLCGASCRLARSAHTSHCLMAGACGDLGAGCPIVWCRKCCLYSSVRATGLKKPCNLGLAAPRHAKAFSLSVHPHSGLPIWGRHSVPGTGG